MNIERNPCLSNCEPCEHKQANSDPNLHCYMFKEPPEGICAQHMLNEHPDHNTSYDARSRVFL